jgi:predicted O-methyltransferase YrrM
VRSLFSIYDIDDLVRLDLPWWCLGATGAVESFLARRQQARVFEYGSGASTVWLARRAREVISVEHDAPWHAVVASRLASHDNARLVFVPADSERHADAERYGSEKAGWQGRTFFEYAHAIYRFGGSFDLIVVDGRARGACLEVALGHLAPDGILVFDNSGRKRYRQAIENSGLKCKEYRGLTACLPYPDSTTLLSNNPTLLAGLPDSRAVGPTHGVTRGQSL